MGTVVRRCRDCDALIPNSGRKRCRDCQTKRNAIFNARPQYDQEWRKISRATIAAEPWCHWPGCDRTDDLTCDHIVPVSRGGTDDLHNLTVLCRSHNSQKGNRT
jgi:5-methylcytosine-specific restriction endonuclease McrA